MSPPQVKPVAGGGQFSCDMLIYDEEADRHVRIQWKEAVKACLVQKTSGQGEAAIGPPSGNGGVLAGTTVAGGEKMGEVGQDGVNKDLTAGDWKDLAQKWSVYNDEPTNENWNEANTEAGRDVRIVVARPFIEHLMHNAVLTVAGRDTGATLFGPAECATRKSKTRAHCSRARSRLVPLCLAACSSRQTRR